MARRESNGYYWRTKTMPLTKEQKERGVIYSSELIVTNQSGIPRTRHEVMNDDPNKLEKIDNLRDVSFFQRMARDFGYSVINEVRR